MNSVFGKCLEIELHTQSNREIIKEMLQPKNSPFIRECSCAPASKALTQQSSKEGKF